MASSPVCPGPDHVGRGCSRTISPIPRPISVPRNLLCLPPEQVMMVAAHNHDLKAAQKLGLKTASWRARPNMGRCRNMISRPGRVGTSSPRISAASPQDAMLVLLRHNRLYPLILRSLRQQASRRRRAQGRGLMVLLAMRKASSRDGADAPPHHDGITDAIGLDRPSARLTPAHWIMPNQPSPL